MMRIKTSVNRFRHIVTALTCFLLSALPVAADSIAWTPGISLSATYYGAVPISESLMEQETLPLRSQMSMQLDAAPLSIRFGRLTLNGGVWLRYTSRSLYWGDTVYRPFWSVGPAASIHIQCTDMFGIQFGGAALYCFNPTVQQAFAAIDTEITPTIRFQLTDHHWLSIIVPVRMQFRQDIFGVQVGIGAKWNYDSASVETDDQEVW